MRGGGSMRWVSADTSTASSALSLEGTRILPKVEGIRSSGMIVSSVSSQSAARAVASPTPQPPPPTIINSRTPPSSSGSPPSILFLPAPFLLHGPMASYDLLRPPPPYETTLPTPFPRYSRSPSPILSSGPSPSPHPSRLLPPISPSSHHQHHPSLFPFRQFPDPAGRRARFELGSGAINAIDVYVANFRRDNITWCKSLAPSRISFTLLVGDAFLFPPGVARHL
ncbi:hypothetical protein C8R45DRAFT_1181199 [Mycena sanguinolenta]|nr:hypothetical protein C8R45DRAFT_1181199 [Mycena sanguinolenta]